MSHSGIGLTKSIYVAGLQCRKRLFLEKYHRERRDVLTVGDSLRLSEGLRVGQLARNLFPQGVAIDAEAWEWDYAEAQTSEAMAKGVPAIFEAAFSFEDFVARVDILKRNPDGSWEVWEVKSSLAPQPGEKPKEEHLQDLAFQWWVAKNAGVKVGRACLVLLNRNYTYPGGEYRPEDVFRVVDVTEEVKERESKVASTAYEGLEVLQGGLPDVLIGPHCRRPYQCPFFGFCHEGRPRDHIWSLPRLDKVYSDLVALGVERIPDIPESVHLDPLQQRVVEVVRTQEPYIAREGLRRALKEVQYPVHFIDFETVTPTLPLFPGTRAFQVLPFQWSLHVLNEDGTLEHYEYVHRERTDPRRSFCEALQSSVREGGAIVIYSKYEMRRIRELVDWDVGLAGNLAKMLDERSYDLLDVVKNHVYLPEFEGSFSLKVVAPALLGEDFYGDLRIRDGGTASARYLQFLLGEDDEESLFQDLLEYCAQDTETLVHIYHKLCELAGVSGTALSW